MLGIEDSSIIEEFRKYTGIHEHDFTSIKAQEGKSIVCLTCGSLYCEKCGKLLSVNIIHPSLSNVNIEQEINPMS